MNYDHDDTGLEAAFACVRQYDPATYARMHDSAWHVSVNPFDLDFGLALAIMSSPGEMAAEGVTLPGPHAPGGVALTWINMAMIRAHASDDHISVTPYVASILVHEFRHIHTTGHNEQEAFAAGSAFDALIPGHDGQQLKADSDEAAAFERAHPEQYNPAAFGMRA